MPRTPMSELVLQPLGWLESIAAPAAPRYPATFVVGAPRTGTTLPSVHALAAFELAYIPNAAKAHPRTVLVRARRALARGSWQPDHRSTYGRLEGELAPSDGWEVFEHYLGPPSEACAAAGAAARGLTRLVAGLERLFGAPFLAKNNANSMRVETLGALFPGAFFVHVTRDLPEAAASLLEARRRHGVPLGAWWSAAPPQLLGRTFTSEMEQVTQTLRGIDGYLRGVLPRIAPGRHLELGYEDFCAEPTRLLAWLEQRYAEAGVVLRRRPGSLPQRFQASRLTPAQHAELERELAAYLDRSN